MKKILVFAFCICSDYIHSQMTPEFIMPFWFEDSKGNKDTIWIGGDYESSYSEINPQFGEVAISEPYDSVFEVRAVHGFDQSWKTSKIIVEDAELTFTGCILPAHTRIMFNCKYPPMKISWDTSILATNYPCNINTILTPDTKVFLLQNWYQAEVIHCMMTQNEVVMDDLAPSISNQLEHFFEVEGAGSVELPGLYYTGFWDAPHCFTTLGASSEKPVDQHIAVSPNPVTDYFRLSAPFGTPIRAVDMSDLSGRLIERFEILGSAIDWSMEHLPAGIYFLKIERADGQIIGRRLVKN